MINVKRKQIRLIVSVGMSAVFALSGCGKKSRSKGIKGRVEQPVVATTNSINMATADFNKKLAEIKKQNSAQSKEISALKLKIENNKKVTPKIQAVKNPSIQATPGIDPLTKGQKNVPVQTAAEIPVKDSEEKSVVSTETTTAVTDDETKEKKSAEVEAAKEQQIAIQNKSDELVVSTKIQQDVLKANEDAEKKKKEELAAAKAELEAEKKTSAKGSEDQSGAFEEASTDVPASTEKEVSRETAAVDDSTEEPVKNEEVDQELPEEDQAQDQSQDEEQNTKEVTTDETDDNSDDEVVVDTDSIEHETLEQKLTRLESELAEIQKINELLRADIEERKAKIAELTEEISVLTARIIQLEAMLESSRELPNFVFTRLAQGGDLENTAYPFMLAVYGVPAKKDAKFMRKAVEESGLKIVSKSQSKLRWFGWLGAKPIMDRYLISGVYSDVLALAEKIGKELIPGNMLVSLKPVENVEVDTYISWTPKKDSLKMDNKLWVLLQSRHQVKAGENIDVERIQDPTVLLSDQCGFVSVECVQSLMDKGMLKVTSNLNEDSELLEDQSSLKLAAALKLSVILDNIITKRGESLMGHVASQLAENFKTYINDWWKNPLGKEKIVVPSDYAIRNMEIESRVWVKQRHFLNRDPVQKDLLLTERDTLLNGAVPKDVAYIAEDDTNRYYLLPLASSAGYPEKWVNDDLNTQHMDELKKHNFSLLKAFDPSFDLETELNKVKDAAEEKDEDLQLAEPASDDEAEDVAAEEEDDDVPSSEENEEEEAA